MRASLWRAALGCAALAALGAGCGALAQKGPGISLPTARGEPGSRGAASGAQSAWVKSHESSVRLIAGAMPDESDGQARLLYAGVELRLSQGWKTYWRHPGDDGGLPPTFDWSAARNLKSARVLYPAPQRLASKTGTTIGYEGGVIFPVLIEPADRARPVELLLRLEYGICREICVPAEVHVELVVDPGLASMPAALAASLAAVPRPAAKPAASAGLPHLAKGSAVLKGPSPALVFDVAAGASGEQPDLFIEVAGGMHLPMPTRVDGPKGGIHRFRVDLKGVEEAAQLPGKTLALTITGRAGGTETSWTVP